MVVIRPETTPILSSSALTSGARQLVVHEAFEMTLSEPFSVLWLTPNTTVRSTSFSPGAEMITFFAPAWRCAPAFALEVKRPVHSMTTSTPRLFQGSLAGSRRSEERRVGKECRSRGWAYDVREKKVEQR